MNPSVNYEQVVLETFPEQEFIDIISQYHYHNIKHKIPLSINQSMFRYPLSSIESQGILLNNDERIIECFVLNPSYTNISMLCSSNNEDIIEFLINHIFRNSDGTYNLNKIKFISWYDFFRNPTNAACNFINELFQKFPSIINIITESILENTNPMISHIIKQYIEKYGLPYDAICDNQCEEVVDILIEKNAEISTLIRNSHPKVFNYIKEELDKLQDRINIDPITPEINQLINNIRGTLRLATNENIINLVSKYAFINTDTEFFKELSKNKSITAYEILSKEIEKEKLEDPENEPLILDILDWSDISENPLYSNLLIEYPNGIKVTIFNNPSPIIIDYLKNIRKGNIESPINNFEGFLKRGLTSLLQNQNTDAFSILSDEEIEELFKNPRYFVNISKSKILFPDSEPYILK